MQTMEIIRSQLQKQLEEDITEIPPLNQQPQPNATEYPQLAELFQNPKVLLILKSMVKNPLIIQATLNFIQRKEAEIALAQLQTLYTPEELENMGKKLKKK